MVSKYRPKFVFLMETKVCRDHAERLKYKMGFEGLFYVDNVGRSGGLVLFWKDKFSVSLISFSKNHIDVKVSLENANA